MEDGGTERRENGTVMSGEEGCRYRSRLLEMAGETRVSGQKRSERDVDYDGNECNISDAATTMTAAKKGVRLVSPSGGLPLQLQSSNHNGCESSPIVCDVHGWMDETPDTAEMENIAVLEKREMLKKGGWQEEEARHESNSHGDEGIEHGVPAPVPFFLETGSKRLEDYAPNVQVAEALLKAGMPEILYDWQAECLNMSGVLQGSSNLVYCAPTR